VATINGGGPDCLLRGAKGSQGGSSSTKVDSRDRLTYIYEFDILSPRARRLTSIHTLGNPRHNLKGWPLGPNTLRNPDTIALDAAAAKCERADAAHVAAEHDHDRP
jgi:hypothetical protein